jgi:large subunit ribosomal protein L7/L12
MDKKLDTILTQISELSVLELSELVKALEEKFDVKLSLCLPLRPPELQRRRVLLPREEKVNSMSPSPIRYNKIAVIKAIREFKPELGLKEAKVLLMLVPPILELS